MKAVIVVLILTLSFQPWTKADDIREFEIEGMSVGDSLLDFYEISEIKESEKTHLIIQNQKNLKLFSSYQKKRNFLIM